MQVMKTFNLRIPKDMWVFLKKNAAENDTSMSDILIKLLERYREKKEKNN